jgi:hypothetical protein
MPMIDVLSLNPHEIRHSQKNGVKKIIEKEINAHAGRPYRPVRALEEAELMIFPYKQHSTL